MYLFASSKSGDVVVLTLSGVKVTVEYGYTKDVDGYPLTTERTCNVTGTVGSFDLKQKRAFDKKIPCGKLVGDTKNVCANGSYQPTTCSVTAVCVTTRLSVTDAR